MAKTLADYILGALNQLSDGELDLFKHKLSELHEIGYGLIEKATRIAIATRIINKFTKEHAVARTAEVLRAIDLGGQASTLEKKVNADRGVARGEETGGGASANTVASGSIFTRTEGRPGQHFVIKYQVELIEGVKLVKPILDRLQQMEVIRPEMYKVITVENTPFGQMRELIQQVIIPGDNGVKDKLFRILEELEPCLMQHLKGMK